MRKALILVWLGTTLAACASGRNVSISMKKAKGFVWKSEKSANFVFYFEPRSPAERDIEKIKASMERERSAVEALLGAASRLEINVFLVDSPKRMKDIYLNGIQEAGKRMGKTLPVLEKEWLAELAKVDASAVQYQVQ